MLLKFFLILTAVGGPDMADEPSHLRAERSGVNRTGYLTNRPANTRADEYLILLLSN